MFVSAAMENKATGGMQLPKNDDGLLDDVYLAGFSDAPTPAPAVAVSAPEPVRAPIASNEKMQATGVQPQEFLERKKMFVTEVGLLEWLSDYENASDELAVVLKAFK